MWFFLGTTLGLAILINLGFFAVAFLLKKDWFTDVTYALTFVVINVFVMTWNKNYSLVALTLFVVNTLWALRLGSFLLVRVIKTKGDKRFDTMRDKFWRFLGFWVLQGLSVWVVNLPNTIVISSGTEFNLWSIVPIFVCCFGLIFETIADVQKFLWHKKGKTSFINKGLWKISRHPNYFGEIVFWMGTCLFLLTTNGGLIKIIGFASPVYLVILLNFVSGINIIEVSWHQKYAKLEGFEQYLRETPCIVPFVGKKGKIRKMKNNS